MAGLKHHLETLVEEAMEEEEEEGDDEHGDAAADRSGQPEDAALNRCCGLFLADIAHPGTSTPPVTISTRGPGMLPVGPYLGACETIAYTLAVVQAENGHRLERSDEAQVLRVGWLIRALRHMTRSPAKHKAGRAAAGGGGGFGGSSSGGGIETARSLARLILGGCSKLNIGRGSSGMLALNEPLLTQNIWCVLVAASADSTFTETNGKKAVSKILGQLIRTLYLARMLQVLSELGGIFAVAGSNDTVPEVSDEVRSVIGLNEKEMMLTRLGMQLGSGLGAGVVEVLDTDDVVNRLRGAKERLQVVEGAGKAFLSCVCLLVTILNAPEAGFGEEHRIAIPDWTLPLEGVDVDALQAVFKVREINTISSLRPRSAPSLPCVL